jgi:glycosyltransferase involved in cell wall biosynthesis
VDAVPPALAAVRARHPHLRAVIAGDGPLRTVVAREVARLGLEEAVELPGFVPAGRLSELMAGAACVVVPSRRDGHGMVAAEAAAAGAPVVVAEGPDSALPELVVEGVNGAVAASAEPDDLAGAIERVLHGGPALRGSTAAWWERNRERLSAQASIERVRALYRELRAGP